MNTALPMYEWNQIPWPMLERMVFKFQKRIYRASQRGDVKTVHRLQRLLTKSWAAKCIAVRQVTQLNQGKRTAGVDGIKSIVPKDRFKLVENLDLKRKPRPIRRVWIPKPGKDEERPLGIPVMHDRATQALVKLALEPEWEAKFEPNSFGFRPGRSVHDAIETIFNATRYKGKYVLDADIAKCFDRIDHDALLNKLHTLPYLRRLIKGWLKAGVMDGGKVSPTTEGTPQGGVISPLLANVALHGMENLIKERFPTTWEYVNDRRVHVSSPAVIRYADDFLVIHQNLEVVQQCQRLIENWLEDMGLTLSPSKTRITHTLKQYDGETGFDFLGFNVRQYVSGTHQSGRVGGQKIGFKVLIKPASKNVRSHYRKLANIVAKHKGHSQERLIASLNPVIRGWCNYYDAAVSKHVFGALDNMMFRRLKRWARFRHSSKSNKWFYKKYWQTVGKDNWVFATPRYARKPVALKKHKSTPIQRHIKVQPNRSPFDGDWTYWGKRLSRCRFVTKEKRRLLIRQKGLCLKCGLVFKDGDVVETDHILSTSRGGKDYFNNKQLLHRHCHHRKTALEIKKRSGRIDKPQVIEEPDEGKLSRPVLKPSQGGDSLA